jgi:hypothetical protein
MNFERKNGGLPKPHPSGFGKPTGLPPVFTGFVNLAHHTARGHDTLSSHARTLPRPRPPRRPGQSTARSSTASHEANQSAAVQVGGAAGPLRRHRRGQPQPKPQAAAAPGQAAEAAQGRRQGEARRGKCRAFFARAGDGAGRAGRVRCRRARRGLLGPRRRAERGGGLVDVGRRRGQAARLVPLRGGGLPVRRRRRPHLPGRGRGGSVRPRHLEHLVNRAGGGAFLLRWSCSLPTVVSWYKSRRMCSSRGS